MKKLILIVCFLMLALLQMPAVANVTTGSWFMDQSNTFADGINYGQVDIQADDSDGKVYFTVDAFIVPDYGTPPFANFGIQAFGFNYTNVTSDPSTWTFVLPSNWIYAGSGHVDGFGYFLVTADGTGGSRQDPLTFDITLKAGDEAQAIASNFAVFSTGQAGEGNAFFVAHVAGFGTGGEESHWIAAIPAPGAILLGGIGVGLVGWLRRRRTL